MNTAVINIKTDPKLKMQAHKVAKQMGLPLGTILNHYLRRLVDQKQVTFYVPETPNKKTEALLKRASRDYKAGRNIVGPFKTAAEMDAYLDS